MEPRRLIVVMAAVVVAASIGTLGYQDNASVTGIVIDAASKAPVRGAEVSFNDGRYSVSVLTASDGSFRFSKLSPGSYRIRAAKNLAEGAYGRRWIGGDATTVPLATGQNHPLTILLWPAASISGTVLDDRNLPIADVLIRAARLDETGTASSWSAANLAGSMLGPSRVPSVIDLPVGRTNDRGEYEINRLTPGRYVVCVPIAYATPTPPASDRSGRAMTFVTTCAPSARSASGATVITVGLGEERTGIDIQLRPERRFRVSGRIVQPADSFKDVELTLTPVAATSVIDSGPSSSSDGERFVFLSVPAGDYWLEARRSVRHAGVITRDERGLWSRQPISVTDNDLDDVVVELQPGFSISGRFVCEGAVVGEACALQPPKLQGQPGFGIPSIEGDGRFTVRGLPPNFYALTMDPLDLRSGWHLRSAVIAGQDVTKTGVEVRDRDLTDLVLTCTREQTVVRGLVRDNLGPTEDAVVVIFPQDTTWKLLARNTPFVRAVSPTFDGRYEVSDLPEGDYAIAAVPGSGLDDFPSRDRLSALRSVAGRIHVGFGTPVVMDLVVRSR